jgi:GNAT superfamily N-acetyltransferase
VSVRVRPRTSDDLPELVAVLAAQQPVSRYPLRWPLPFPVEDFLVREGQEAAWVAEHEGRVVGHVAVGRPRPAEEAGFVEAAGTRDLACVAVLFVDVTRRGLGIGGRLLDTAVAWAVERDLLPALDVVPSHGPAVAFYRARGWRQVGTLHPDWLPDPREPLLVMTLPGRPGDVAPGTSLSPSGSPPG